MTHPRSIDYKEEELSIARFAKALAHPARVAIMKHLALRSDCCFTDILNELPIAQATVSQHLSELKDAGLIKGNINPPKVFYCIDKDNWKRASELFRKLLEGINCDNKDSGCC